MTPKIWLVLAVIVGLATLAFAARHELGWTLFGLITVGLDIHNYLEGEDIDE